MPSRDTQMPMFESILTHEQPMVSPNQQPAPEPNPPARFTLESFINDIPLDVARQAHAGTSFTPEKRGDQERQGYASTLLSDYEELQKLIVNKSDMKATLDAEFDRYREGYRQRTISQLHARSRCMSSMITGPANFPTRRNQKRFDTEQKRVSELIEFRKRALEAIRKTLCPELRPIMSGDSDAVERLQEKIAEAEKLQSLMRDTNAAIRKNWKSGEASVIAALVGLGHSEAVAKEMIQPGRFGGMGYASFELTNNNANIRRMKERLTVISRAKTAEATTIEGANARIEDCPAENRIRLFFPGKPNEETRTKLKSNGFRWTPTLGCWQAYRNDKTLAVGNRIAVIG